MNACLGAPTPWVGWTVGSPSPAISRRNGVSEGKSKSAWREPSRSENQHSHSQRETITLAGEDERDARAPNATRFARRGLRLRLAGLACKDIAAVRALPRHYALRRSSLTPKNLW